MFWPLVAPRVFPPKFLRRAPFRRRLPPGADTCCRLVAAVAAVVHLVTYVVCSAAV